MQVSQENVYANSSLEAYRFAPVDTAMAAYPGQPILTLRTGADLDPGIRRKYKPNEDTILITHGIMPSATMQPKPFVLLIVADGMGGQGHGRKASRLASWYFAEYVSDTLRYTHPKRNQIYRSVGTEASVEVDTAAIPLVAGDTLLLCSDGLWEMVRDQQIEAILTAPVASPSATAHALILAALEGGGQDNVSAIVAQLSNRE